MKKIILVCLTCLFFSTTSFAKDLVIGAPMPSFADKWLTYLYDAIRGYDNAHDDLEIKLTDANEDPSRMLNDVDNFIDSGVDALLIVPTDVATIKPIAKKAKRAGIPLIILNRIPNDEDMENVSAYVGSESIQAGILQGQQIVKMFDGKEAKVAILMGQLGHEAQIKRTEGVNQIFDEQDNIQVVAEQEGRWDRAKGIQITEDLLQLGDINVIASNNDEMAIGALLAANKAGIKDENLIIAGVDATPDALQYLGEGLDFTIFQSAKGQGGKGAEIAHMAAKGEPIEKIYFIDYELVLPEDKQTYLDKY